MNRGEFNKEIFFSISEILNGSNNLSEKVNAILELVTDVFDASRAYIFELTDSTHYVKTYEWCTPEHNSEIRNQQNKKNIEFTYSEIFKNDKKLVCPDINDLNIAQKDYIEKQGIKAFIQHGIYYKGSLCALIGVDDCKSARLDWADDQKIKLLEFISNMLSMHLISESKFQNILELDIIRRMGSLLSGIFFGLKVNNDDKEYTYIYLSESLAALQGYTCEEFVKVCENSAYKNIHPLDRERVHRISMAQYDKGNFFSVKYRVIHKNGSIIWIQDYGKRVQMSDGTIRHYGLIQDITEKEIAEQKLKAEKTMFRDAIEKKTLFIVKADITDGKIIDDLIKPNGTNLLTRLGYRVPADYDSVWKTFIEMYDVSYLSDEVKYCFTCDGIRQIYKEKYGSKNFDVYLRKSGWYINILPLIYIDPENGHLMCYCPVTNITEAKKKEFETRDALKNALVQAEKANKAKSIFLSNMSHDIRTPMNAVVGYTDLALNHFADKEKVKDYLGKIQASSSHLLNLINNVLDISRIESGKMELEETEVSLFQVMHEIRNIVFADIQFHKLHLDIESIGVVDENVFCDILKLNQIILNCVGNSIKYTPAGGKIDFKIIQISSQKNGYASYDFKICDNGIGMSDEFIAKIFTPFERERNTTISGIQGTGLGMSIVKGLVEMMGGQISIRSKIKEGTEVTISLNFRVSGESKKARKDIDEFDNETETEQNLTGKKILLVEDNAINCEIAKTLLEEQGFIVDNAENGAEAVEIMSKSKKGDFDVILMDIQMPVMDGYTAAKKIRSLPDKDVSSIPIIATTANAFAEDIRHALEVGMDAHISKPISIEKVIDVIGKVCR